MMTVRNAALLALSAALLALGACTSPTGIIDAATIPAEDRSFQDSTVDAEIKFAINKKMLEEESRLFVDVNTVVYDGRVLLTGKVETTAAHDHAERIAYQVPNVKEVINELVVTTDRSFVSGVNDVANEVKIKAQLVATSGVKSINYRWRSLARYRLIGAGFSVHFGDRARDQGGAVGGQRADQLDGHRAALGAHFAPCLLQDVDDLVVGVAA